MASAGRQVPIQAQVTMELTGRMLLGTEIGAALAAIDPLHVDIIGLNCATGPGRDERAPPPPQPAQPRPDLLPAQRRAAERRRRRHALRPHRPRSFVDPPDPLRRRASACRSSAAAAAPPPSSSPGSSRPPAASTVAPRNPVHEPSATSIYSAVPLDQDTSFLAIGERTNANGSKKFREAMLDGDWDTCLQDGHRAGQGGRPHPRRVRRLRGPRRCRRHGGDRQPLRHTGERAADGRLHRGQRGRGRAAVDRRPAHPQLRQPRGRRRARHPARHVPVARPRVRRGRGVHLHRRGGPGPRPPTGSSGPPSASTTSPSSATASSRPTSSSTPWRSPSPPASRRAAATASRPSRASASSRRSCPGVHTTLGLSNVSFGLNPAARHVLNSVFLHECTQAGLDSAIVHASKILPLNRIPDEQRDVVHGPDLRPPRRRGRAVGRRPQLRPAHQAARHLRRREGRGRREGGPLRLDHRAPPQPAHHRRRPRRHRGRPRRGARRGPHPARHRQRRACSPA